MVDYKNRHMGKPGTCPTESFRRALNFKLETLAVGSEGPQDSYGERLWHIPMGELSTEKMSTEH